MEIVNASRLEKEIHAEAKESKFNSILTVQIRSIEESMHRGAKCTRWIFSDNEAYCNSFELTWKSEFEEKAKSMFEEADYKICADTIRW